MKNIIIIGYIIFLIPLTTWAASFPNAGVDSTTSLGRFSIRLTQEIGKRWFNLNNCPGDLKDQNDPCVLHSPGLEDRSTQIGRSDPHFDGDNIDEQVGASIACTGTQDCPNSGFLPQTVKDSDFQVVPNIGIFKEGPNNTEEVHTQILSFHLVPADCYDSDGFSSGIWVNWPPSATAVRAGLAAPNQPRSLGEVESLGAGGFPAESFFNVFVEVDIDFDPDGMGPKQPDNVVDITLFNKKPLVIRNRKLNKFPPSVVYIHGGSDSAPLVYDKATGEPIGWVTLAGHGVGYSCYGVKGPIDFDTVYQSMRENKRLESHEPVEEDHEDHEEENFLGSIY